MLPGRNSPCLPERFLWYNLDCGAMKELLKTLMETFRPSGYEQAIRDVVLGEITPLADEIRVDTMGYLIARKGSQGKNGCLGIPPRCVHAPSEMVDMDDLENAAALMTAMLSRPVGIEL